MKEDYSEKQRSVENEIASLKKRHGNKVLILGHHYQREEIVLASDIVGDSYFLAKSSSERQDAKYIIFCGVKFMAEAARILCSPDQTVIHPDMEAGCPLADMADIESVSQAWEDISGSLGSPDITPITYINSSAELKAFCGRNSGMVCTSSNARRAMESALKQRPKLFFFPDQHLGMNAALEMGIDEGEILLWDRKKLLGGHHSQDIRRAKVILWDGYCHVHTLFEPEDVAAVRKKYHGVKVIVHPESSKEVVKASDSYGSTSFIVDYVKKAPKGSIIAIGTEINLISRIAKENPDKTVIELKRSLCPNMFRITLDKLLKVLRDPSAAPEITVAPKVKKEALIALKRMLEL